ncbi:MAG: hypothetical protein IJ060_11975 [Oscillospiraceae bacterium]|nr:hypothetical protein [Oscillospiraceae bacterium]
MEQQEPQQRFGRDGHNGAYVPRHADDTPRKRKRPLLNEDGTPRKRKRPPLNEDGTPRKRKRPPLNEDGTPRKRKRPPQNTDSTAVTKRAPAAHAAPKGKSRASKKRSKHGFPFWIPVLVLYTALFIWVSGKIVSRVRTYLAEYEASRPQYVMDDYTAQLDESFYQQMLEKAAGDIRTSEYESAESVRSALPADTTMHSYTYRQNDALSTEQKPVYEIISGGVSIARVTLSQSGSTAKFKMPLWSADEPESLIQVHAEPQYRVSVTLPDTATLRINGVTVPASRMTEAEPEIQFDETALKYGEQPGALHFEADGFYLLPAVEVTAADGKPITPEEQPDADAALQEYLFVQPDETEPDEALVQRVHGLTEAYISHVTYTGRDSNRTIAVLSQYMLQGSPAMKLMRAIVGDIRWNNPYSNRDNRQNEISHVKMYSDKLCTVQVDFDIAFTLFITNEYAGSVRWIMVNTGNGWYAEDFVLLPPDSDAAPEEVNAGETDPGETT